MGSMAADVSPPVKPPGPESQLESSYPGVCQLSPSWQSVLYFHTLVSPKMLNCWAVPVSKSRNVIANTRTPAFARRGAKQRWRLNDLGFLKKEFKLFMMVRSPLLTT